MDPLRTSPSVDLIEALNALRADGRPSKRRTDGSKASGAAAPLRDRLRQIALEMRADDPASYQLTRSRFLHCILGAEWGEGSGSDPTYGDVIAAIERDVTENPALDNLFREAMRRLLASK